MEYALGDPLEVGDEITIPSVLILVLMEYALGEALELGTDEFASLNPCSNGICSRRDLTMVSILLAKVLILVLIKNRVF